MNYIFRFQVEDEYLLAIGRATYNFTYLEKVVVDLITKLSHQGLAIVTHPKPTAWVYLIALKSLISSTKPGLQSDLADFCDSFEAAIKGSRNKLLHAHPCTAKDGSQQFYYPDKEWPIDSIYEIAKEFEEIALIGSEIYHKC